ncbi:hypothetical protein D1AOALGA4SA_3872 [Olavius algarvensis Delta 1 endosymbiont]|nr:hypothetical protein D1AOALGA4SA_3872 [Olavius algarvensis Delta 1 endosymbiont]
MKSKPGPLDPDLYWSILNRVIFNPICPRQPDTHLLLPLLPHTIPDTLMKLHWNVECRMTNDGFASL